MTLRAIEKISIPGVEPSAVEEFRPEFLWVDPVSLRVDESYQRNLSERSVTLIRRIVGAWDWRAFKPPICVRDEDVLHVIDGQHTAIAAATHPAINEIPVMIVPPSDVEARALSFVRHNRDRIQVTQQQLHYALVAAGDEDALTIHQICNRAGARVLKYPPSSGRYKPGDIMAVGSIQSLLKRRYAIGARRIVEICAKAKLAPISAAALRAVEHIVFHPDYTGAVTDDDLVTAIRATSESSEKDAGVFAAAHDVPHWRALAVVWFKASKKTNHGR